MDEVEVIKQRCRDTIIRIERLPSSTKIPESCKKTLLRLVNSELNFLSRLTSPVPLSCNIGYLEAVVYILQQPFITGVSRVCKPIKNGLSSVHVDLVCTLNKIPVWIIVSDRNPLYISWNGCQKNKGLRARVEEILATAGSLQSLKPSSVVMFFTNGLGNFVRERLRDEFRASDFSLSEFDFCEEVEDEWINVHPRSFCEACVLEIKLDFSGNAVLSSECGAKYLVLDAACINPRVKGAEVNLGDAFGSLLSRMKFGSVGEQEHLLNEGDLINFDTTALIALVSGISNGCAEKLLATPDIELRQQFKGNTQFVIAQAMSEIQNSIDEELGGVVAGKRGMICESVLTEFKELVLMCGGRNEKLRANELLKCFIRLKAYSY